MLGAGSQGDWGEAADDELMLAFRAGRVEAFEQLFDRHHAAAYRFARLMLQDAGAAEEVLQEGFLAVAQSADSYNPQGRFRTWLMRIVRNNCLNRLAKAEARPAGPMPPGQDPASREPGPAEAMSAAEQVARVQRAMGYLPTRQREALLLHAFEQLSYEEIARVMEAPVNTVKTLIHRARAALAAAMGG